MIPNCATKLLVVHETSFPPAVGKLITRGSEQFPIFDRDVLKDAQTALDADALVFLKTRVSNTTHRDYVSAIHVLNPIAKDMPCVFCETGSGMVLLEPDEGVSVARYVCLRCERILYLDKPPMPQLPHLDMQARASIDFHHDAIFWLDHGHEEAHFVDTIPRDTERMPPFHGVHASLEPIAESELTHDGDHLLLNARKLMGKDLRLQGYPWNGRTTYRVIA